MSNQLIDPKPMIIITVFVAQEDAGLNHNALVNLPQSCSAFHHCRKMASPFRSIILVALASVLGLGFYDFLTNFENNQCEMTYMYQLPEYLEVPLGDELKGSYPRYKLYLYGEGNFKLSGIPVLFIPGNAGSYKQVRSLASVAIKKAEKKNFHFNYFALDFNEELGALFGGYVDSQTEFASACIEQILLLYKDASHPPNSVVLVGHSMGGMVARALFTLPNFDKSRVHTVITQATPHQLPVVALDLNLAAFYDRVNSFWRQEHNLSLSHVTVLSTGGGFRDTHVRNDLSNMIGLHDVEKQVSTSTMSLPGGWVSTDHLCHVWCKQLVLSTKRALFDMVDPKSKQIAVNTLFRIRTFYHHFIHNPGSNKVKFTFDAKVALDENVQWEVRKKPYWRMNRKSLEKKRYSVLTMPFFDKEQFAAVAISNIPNVAWIGTCQLQVKQTACTEMENISPGANLLPPQAANRKVHPKRSLHGINYNFQVVHLSVEELRTSTHIVTVLPQSTSKVEVAAELYNITERHLDYNITGILDFFRNFPSSVMAEGVLIERTAPNAIFYNITLNGLEIPLQAHTVHVECVKCSDAATAANAGTVAKMHVPWGSGNTFKFIPIGKNGSIDVKLLSGMPANFPYKAQLHLYLAPTCVYRVTIDTAFKQLYGQFGLSAFDELKELSSQSCLMQSEKERAGSYPFYQRHQQCQSGGDT
ncbi:hypothetical protein CAPTEDRAFT_189001 [Capitella teleta]|uniref:GPI inositol-deacylase n=1 Tax=Capitella teleta TaxID=283909 RepID=R7UUR2_CAPTE|nr:hypothetical protein CAPTEDRAFT_189001 [Capitella teleta]|eukprot:ELU07106.1 hypothetical protein CAPTEDRAFT_189001 [Capitella teleta]